MRVSLSGCNLPSNPPTVGWHWQLFDSQGKELVSTTANIALDYIDCSAGFIPTLEEVIGVDLPIPGCIVAESGKSYRLAVEAWR